MLLVLSLFLVSGAAGLLYQVVWTRLLTLTFGCTVYAVSAVLTAFMGGLGLGSWALSRVADRTARPLRLYGLLEIGVGVYAAFFPLLLGLVTMAYTGAYRTWGLGFVPLSLLKFGLALLLLLTPTVLMGGTLPVLSAHFVRSVRGATRSVAYLYAINTAGAVAGTLLAGFLLVPALGLKASLYLAVGLNLLVGLTVLALERRSEAAAEPEPAQSGSGALAGPPSARPGAAPSPHPRGDLPRPLDVPIALGIMFFAGLLALAFEVVWTRSLMLYMGTTNYSFSTMLSAVLCGIAVGSMVVGLLADRIRRPLLLLALAEAGIGVSALAVLPLLGVVARALDSPGLAALPWGAYNLAKFGLCFALFLLPTTLMGAAFPIAAQVALRDVRRIGRTVGKVYSVNTLGGIFGSALGGFVLIPHLGPGVSFLVLAAGYILLGLTALLLSGRPRWRLAALVPATVLIAALVFQGDLIRFPRKVMLEKIARSGEILAEGDGLEAHVAVNQNGFGFRQLWVNGDVVARSTGSVSGHNMLSHLPMLLARENRKAVVIALGTGISAGTVSLYEPETLDVVEISELVLDHVHLFSHDNYDLARNPRVRFVIDDGRNFVQVTGQDYDVVAAEPLHPWKAGVANLYTKEYYELCRGLLRDGGIVVQWIPLYGLSDQDARDLTATFCAVFPETSYWLFGLDAVLLGHTEPFAVDLPLLRDRMSAKAVEADLDKVNVRGQLDLLHHLVMGPKELPAYCAGARVMSDWHPFLEYDGPKHVHSKVPNTDILLGLRAHRCDPAEYVGEWGPAGDSLRAALVAQNPAWSLTLEGLLAQQNYRDLDRSRAALDEALRIAPYLGDTKYYLSRTLYMMGEALLRRGGSEHLPRAYELLVRSVELAPDSPSALWTVAMLAERVGRMDEGRGYWARLAQAIPAEAPRWAEVRRRTEGAVR